MKYFSIIPLLSLFLLASCTSTGRADIMENPLYMSQLADNKIDYVTTLQIRANERKKPITDPRILRVIDSTLSRARSARKKANEQEDNGKRGTFYGSELNFCQGRALWLDNTLYFGYYFEVDAAPGLHVYLSEHVAPHSKEELETKPYRDLGVLQSPIGPQSYTVPSVSEEEYARLKTIVLYSTEMEDVIGLVQIRIADL